MTLNQNSGALKNFKPGKKAPEEIFIGVLTSTIILPVVLYGCEIWSLTLRVFENRILKRIFLGPRGTQIGSGKDIIVCTIPLI